MTRLNIAKLTANPSKKLKPSKPAEPEAQIVTTVFGKVNRQDGIQFLTLMTCDADGSNAGHVVVARQSGIVECVSLEDGSVSRSHQCFTNEGATTIKFIGLHEHNKTIIACTNKGNVFYLNGGMENGLPDCQALLGVDGLNVMRVNPASPHLFATGGNERDLCVWDIHVIKEALDTQMQVEPVWKAKNVYHGLFTIENCFH